MRLRKNLTAVLAVMIIIFGVFGKFTVMADDMSDDVMMEWTTETEKTTESEAETEKTIESESETEKTTEPEAGTEKPTESEPETEKATELEAETEKSIESETDNAAELSTGQDNSEEQSAEKEEKTTEETSEISDEMPVFTAWIEWSPQGWIVKGAFKDFAADTIFVRTMCSTDGETFRECGQEWNLQWLGSENEAELKALQNQRCLFDSEEPLKSYLAKELDHFYIKLRIVRESGSAYETQTAVIDRGKLQMMPAEFDVAAVFAPSVFVREGRPPNRQCYGRYQITVGDDAACGEISKYLPDTLPVEVQIQKGSVYIGSDIIDCPVKWKSLNLPKLTAGEHVTVLDAAEEIVVPAGVILETQTGIYQTSEPIGLNDFPSTDEVRLVLNVVAKDAQPIGALAEENYGLEMVFQLKPTGAESIRAYTYAKDRKKWVEISGLSLMDAVNAQPSTANSGYMLILGREQEPYRSYREAQEAGEEPAPFLVGLKIKGGVYDGRQLVLAWPDTYELPPNLPEVGGSGGNQGNAGSNDKEDSTEGGQRPGLPQESGNESSPEPPKEAKDELSKTELTQEPADEVIPVIAKMEISENEILENEMPEVKINFPGQQEMSSARYEAAAEVELMTDADMANEMTDSGSDTMADAEMESFGHMEEDVQSDIQEKPKRRVNNADSGMLFIVSACIVVLFCAGIIISQKITGRNILHRFLMRFISK